MEKYVKDVGRAFLSYVKYLELLKITCTILPSSHGDDMLSFSVELWNESSLMPNFWKSLDVYQSHLWESNRVASSNNSVILHVAMSVSKTFVSSCWLLFFFTKMQMFLETLKTIFVPNMLRTRLHSVNSNVSILNKTIADVCLCAYFLIILHLWEA